MFRTMFRNHLLFILQQGLEISERSVDGGWLLLVVRRCLDIRFGYLISRVLIIVTVDTEQFPVAPVRRIVVMVVIFVVHGELAQPLSTELSPATPANFGKKLQGAFPITFLSFLP